MSEIYEKEYFNDEYSKQFAEFRNRYHNRTGSALKERSVDKAPVPNATTVVFFKEDGNGGMQITTGDFVEYFNNCYGNSDRVGAMRRSIANALRKAENSDEYAKKKRCEKARAEKRTGLNNLRTVGRRSVFSHLLFASILVFAVVFLFGSTVTLNQAETRVATLESEITALGATEKSETVVQSNASYLNYAGRNEVEVYEIEDNETNGVAVLRSAFEFLGK